MIGAYNNWENGHSPVSLGRAPWLPLQFTQAMDEIRRAVGDNNERAVEREKAKRAARRASSAT